MEQLRTSMVEAVRMIEDTTTLFYQRKNQEGFLVLDAMLNSIIKTVGEIDNYQIQQNITIFDNQIFNVVVAEVMKALEQKDMVLFSDILIYEVIALFEECYNRI